MANFSSKSIGTGVVSYFRKQVEGKTFVITGPSVKSLGAETAVMLAAANPEAILLLGRSESKILPVIEQIKSSNPTIKAKFYHLDLSSLDSVRRCANEVSASVNKIDVLINYAGIMAVQDYQLSVDGIESQFAANHIGHFLLTNLLMLKLEASGTGARVVNASSIGYMLSEVRFNDWNFGNGKTYNGWAAYGQSKTANILFALELGKRLKSRGISAFSLNPGTIFGTNLGTHLDAASYEVFNRMAMEREMPVLEQHQLKSIDEGCATALLAALDPSLETSSGTFLSDCQVEQTKPYASDPVNAEKLWLLSEKLVGQNFRY